jgi:hypothetical protein
VEDRAVCDGGGGVEGGKLGAVGAKAVKSDYQKALIGAILVVCVIAGVVAAVLYRRTLTATVTAMSWYRAVGIQEWKTVRENGWTVPPDGRTTYTRWEVRYYHTVVTGYRTVCTGTGKTRTCNSQATTRLEPVYDTKYYYDIERWIEVSKVERRGTDRAPRWPEDLDLRYGNEGAPRIGDQRPGTRYSRYVVLFHDKDGYHELDMLESMWGTFHLPGRAELDYNFVGQVVNARAL